MHSFGQTRSSRRQDHLLQTPDAFVRAPLPGMVGATAIVHASPALGAKFTQYTVEFEPGGTLAPSHDQRFIFVLDGQISTPDYELDPNEYAWFPPLSGVTLRATDTARAVVIEKPYDGTHPAYACHGRESDLPPVALMGDPDVVVRHLIPDNPTFDLAVNTMTFQPGATLPKVESHVMEHGLLMLEGSGIYRLGDDWYPVTAGDFIWMAPWLPQWFGAFGKTPAKYLIYKDWNR